MSPERGSRLGSYELLERIAFGGQAEVWSALHAVSGHDVAIKIVATTASSSARFLREIETLADVSHPNVVQIHDVGTLPDGRAWYAMRRYAATLREHLERHGHLSEYETAALLAPIADALGTVHRHGIVHRDVKPSNILLSSSTHALLADFGVARHEGREPLTDAGLVVGSLGFLAPEVLRGDAGSAASDAYSFGAIAFLAVMGHLPGGDAHQEMLLAGVDSDFAAIVGQLLDPNPDSRLDELSLTATDLKRIGVGRAGRELVQEEDDQHEPQPRLSRRSVVLMVLIAILVVLVLAGTTVLLAPGSGNSRLPTPTTTGDSTARTTGRGSAP